MSEFVNSQYPWTEKQVAQIMRALPQKEHLLITIDGPCGSGKTTLAEALCQVLHAPCVHTDDFYIPHAQKTPERLAIPGGNEDVERLCQEFLLPWLEKGRAEYRPYNPFEDRLMDPVTVADAPIVVIEGSYSQLPQISHHADVRVWLAVSRETQLRRILNRNGPQRLTMFLIKWIPLEEQYHQAYQLPSEGSIIISGE